MGGMTVKICGLQSRGVLESIINLPIDYIGFMFAGSKRRVTTEQAKEMIDYLHHSHSGRVLAVGVFVNPGQAELVDIMEECRLDAIQLHGQETPEFCKWVKDTFHIQVHKVFSIAAGNQLQDAEQWFMSYQGAIDMVLLDTHDPVAVGGTGKTFAWELIPGVQVWTSRMNLPLVIAGGLDADNVGRLIGTYHPDGVDVSSGVETGGVKDIAKITAFVERARK